MSYLAVENDRRIYFEHHAGSGRPVVLVHGWAATSRCWDTTAPALLAAGHEVVLLDLRACGLSDNDFDDVSIAALAADVVALCDRLALTAPVINGWSLGGTPDAVEDVLAGAAANRADTFRAVAGAVCAQAPSDDVLNWIWGMFMQMGPAGDRSLRDLARIDLRKELAQIEVPILSVHGSDDAFVPISGARAAVDTARNARLVVIDGCGHAPFLEARDRYLSELLEFLAA